MLFRSTNGGGSWNNVGLDGPGLSTVAPDPTNSQVVYLGAARGADKAKNGGKPQTALFSELF